MIPTNEIRYVIVKDEFGGEQSRDLQQKWVDIGDLTVFEWRPIPTLIENVKLIGGKYERVPDGSKDSL